MTGRDGTEKKYELLEVREDGTEVRLYENGEKRNQRGHLLEPAPWNNIITSETAGALARRRKEKILEEIEKGIVDITKTNAPAEAIAAIVKKRAAVAMTDETRTGNEAAKIVLQAVDAYQDRKPAESEHVERHEYALDDETKALLESILEQRRINQGKIIDAEE